jgi:hypothetical protein
MDLPMLLEELADVAELAMGDERWGQHLLTVSEELSSVLQDEKLYLKNHPRLDAAVRSLTDQVGLDSKNPRIVQEKSRIALAHFGATLSVWRADALVLAEANEKEKAIFLHRLSTIATHIAHRGLEEESKRGITIEVCCQSPKALIESVTTQIAKSDWTFRCVVALNGPRGPLAGLISNSLFVQAGRSNGIGNDDVSRKWHQARLPHAFFVIKNMTAPSSRLAADRCILEVSALLNLQNLYHNSASFRVDPEVLLYSQSGEASVVSVSPERHFGLLPRNDYVKLARDTYSLVGSRLDGRLSNAIEFLTLALDAKDAKTALIYLWTVLETVAGDLGVRSSGQRVAERIAPIIAFRRVDKIVTYLALSIHEAHVQANKSPDPTILPNSNDKFIAPEDVLKALLGPEQSKEADHLCDLCSESPLLLHRLYSIAKQFSKPGRLAEALQISRKRLEWQIARIYRARNLLIHRGDSSPYISRLLRNAHYYVSSTISRLLHDLRNHSDWNVDTALIHQAELFEYVVRQLRENAGGQLTYEDLLLRKVANQQELAFGNMPTKHSAP